MQGARDILDELIAHVLKMVGQFIADLFVYCLRDGYAVGLGQAFQPRRDVDAIAEDVLRFGNYIADIDADTESEPSLVRNFGITEVHPALHFNRAGDRLDDARKLREHPVASRFDDPPAMQSDSRGEQLLQMRCETLVSAFFIDAH